MNAKTKAALRKNQKPGANTADIAAIDGAGAVSGKPTTKDYCINPACGKEITPLNRYGSHGTSWTCSGACEKVVDPVSTSIQQQKSLYRPLSGVYQGAAAE